MLNQLKARGYGIAAASAAAAASGASAFILIDARLANGPCEMHRVGGQIDGVDVFDFRVLKARAILAETAGARRGCEVSDMNDR